MKTFTDIEQKAKRYDEALKEVKKWYKTFVSGQNYPATDIKVSYEWIFPELKEPEDERIRKTIIRFFKDNYPNEIEMYDETVTVSKALAWLEKQGEPNPYSGTSFKYDGHTWGMCARDYGVEIIFDGELKAFLSPEKSFIYPIHPQPDIRP